MVQFLYHCYYIFIHVPISIHRFSDIFKTPLWTIGSVRTEDRYLTELSDSLPEFCLHSRALNTQKKYRYAYNSWHNWCLSLGQNIKPLPASDYYIALYLVHLTKANNSSSKIHEAIHAISLAHKLAGYSDPCHSSLVTSVKEGAIHMTAKPVCIKEPITPDHLNCTKPLRQILVI